MTLRWKSLIAVPVATSCDFPSGMGFEWLKGARWPYLYSAAGLASTGEALGCVKRMIGWRLFIESLLLRLDKCSSRRSSSSDK